MTSKTIGSGFRFSAGKIVKRPPKMAAGQKRNQTMKASRLTKAWAAKSRGDRT
jgi:hypothetical protein